MKEGGGAAQNAQVLEPGSICACAQSAKYCISQASPGSPLPPPPPALPVPSMQQLSSIEGNALRGMIMDQVAADHTRTPAKMRTHTHTSA